MTFFLDIVFALSKGVPQLNCLVARAGNNLSIVSTEANRQNVRCMSNEAAGGQSGVEVPETEGVVPGRGKGKLAIRRDNNIRNEVVVAVENSLGVTIRIFVARQLPDNNGLVWIMSSDQIVQKVDEEPALPREAVKIMSGFSEEVAMAVTHPLWPSKDPRKRSDSDMVFSVSWTLTSSSSQCSPSLSHTSHRNP